ncbi:MAG: DUF4288 domain-containing protein [Blastocatellia bacterium]
MAYIPKDAKWYLAWIVQEITVEGDPRNIIHINEILIRADSPDDAYVRALELGKQAEMTYENPDGQRVVSAFLGLQDLQVIHDELEHGAELSYREKIDVSDEEIERMISAKDELGVFLLIESSEHPNYMPNEIWEDLQREMAKRKDSDN